jgi:hypothetical protein
MLAQNIKRYDLECALVRRGEHHVRSGAIAMRKKPVGGGDTPPVAGHQSRELVVRHWRDEVVADGPLVPEKLSGDHCAYCVAPVILRSCSATSVAVEAGDRVGATGLQCPTHDVSIDHGPLSLMIRFLSTVGRLQDDGRR